MSVDAEKLVSNALRTALDVRVVGKTPSNTETAWIRVTQLDASDDPNFLRERWIDYHLQLDIYAGKAGGQPEASTLNREARAALKDIEATTLGGEAVVSRVRFTANPRVPDGDFEPARERFVLDARVMARSA